MKKERILTLAAWLLVIAAVAAHYKFDPWGFYWKVPEDEAGLRLKLVAVAQSHLGLAEADGSHQSIVDAYNSQEVLPVGYVLQSTDSWCAAFVTVSAMEAGLEAFPMECGCQRQIGLWQDLGRWVEDDNAIPLPGDIIYYNWEQKDPGENSGWSDHVGIVVGTKWPFVKVIEGNYDDRVQYRILLLGDTTIRGYGKPDYSN